MYCLQYSMQSLYATLQRSVTVQNISVFILDIGKVIQLYPCMLSCFSCVRFFATLQTVAHQAPVSMGFSRQEHWSGLPCPPPGGLPHPRMESASLTSPALVGRFFITSATWEARNIYKENRIMKTIFMSLVDVRVCLLEFTRGGSCSVIHLLQYHKIGLITIQPCYYKNSQNNTMHSIYKPVENSIPCIQCISKLKTVGKLKLN